MLNKLLGTLLMWIIGAPIYLPWLLARLGIYKGWYLAPFLPPFSWRRWIQLWPASAVFVCYPLIALSPLSDHAVMTVWAGISVAGVVLAVVMVIWNPGWAKPAWQRRLEERYTHRQINKFLETWRHMDHDEWGRLIETEEGLEELVKRAQGEERFRP